MKNLILFIASCSNPIVKEGRDNMSPSIKFSKEHGLFICKYNPSINCMDLDVGKFYINECWAEFAWSYKDQKKHIEIQGLAVNITLKKTQHSLADILKYVKPSLHYHIKPCKINQDTLKLIYYRTPHFTNNFQDRKKTDSTVIYLIK